MLKKIIKYRFILILALLFLAFLELSIYYASFLNENLSTVSARFDNKVVTPLMIKNALENESKDTTVESPRITLFNRLKKEKIKNKVTELTVNTNVIETYGNMSYILPMNFVEGNFVYTKDEKGCVLDTKTAYDLFGTTKALNNSVTWKGKEYIVRGVAKAKDAMMLIEVTDDKYRFSNLEAMYHEKKDKMIIDNQGQLLKNLLHKNNIAEPVAILDGSLVALLLGNICRLPLWILAFTIIFYFIQNTYQLRKSMFLCLLSGTFTIILGMIFIKITKFGVHIPNQFMPTKWSDFEFYVNKYKEIKENMVAARDCTLMPKDILRNSYSFRCTVFLLLCLILLLLFKIRDIGISKLSIEVTQTKNWE